MVQITYDFSFYSSGIYKSEFGDWYGWIVCEFVGYGLNGVKFWKVKNQFGRNWGENGYFRIARGTEIPWGENQTCIVLRSHLKSVRKILS
ncbi:Cathepsin_B [Hexamita inflata]|uniref:Cathepsin B n=1 Tax=Hexamita inflata TaxID=28002 RepID=A0AA86QY88_9EUKA|nr:Cathepsin B [Hexamita inflata]